MLVGPIPVRKKEARQERDAWRGKLGPGRYDTLAAELARVIRLAFAAGATGSLWGLEGVLRHAIRSDLCLQGWTWETADLMAREVLEEAHRKAGARRPTWNEGQPEWVVHEGALIERTRCANCYKPLMDGRPKFCSDLCKGAFHDRLAERRKMTEEQASRLAARWI